MAKVHYIIRDLTAGNPDVPRKLFRDRFASLEEAVGQFDRDIEHGIPVVRIEDAKGNTVREA